MDAENIKTRIRDRLFNRSLSASPELPEAEKAGPFRHEPPVVNDSPRTAYGGQIPGRRAKGVIERLPLVGRLLIWAWRIINLPRWFRQLRVHFLRVAADVDSLKSTVSRNSAATRTLQVSLEAHARAAEETKASLEGLSAEIRRVTDSFGEKSARFETLLDRHEGELTHVKQAAREHDGTLGRMQASLDDLHDGLGKVGDSVEGLNASQEGQEEMVREIMNSLSEEQAWLQDLRETVSRANTPVEVEDTLVMEMPGYVDGETASGDEDGFYLGFENAFRGTEAEIAGRQERYVGYAAEALANVANAGSYFLDVGCGRGEFLRLLKQASVPGRGVETNRLEYETLRAEGLDVALSDANAYLEKLRNGSLAGVSAFQVVEHFPLEYLKKFLALAYRKTARNGVVVLETVNPKCGVALRNFHLDATHVRPYPPELLAFLLQWNGYGEVTVVFSAPCAPQFRVKDAPEYNYMDYAAVGWKR